MMAGKRKTINEILGSEYDSSHSEDEDGFSFSSEEPGSPLKLTPSISSGPAFRKNQDRGHASTTPITSGYRTSGYTPGRTPGRNSGTVHRNRGHSSAGTPVRRNQGHSSASTPSSTVHHKSSSTATPEFNTLPRDPESSSTGTLTGSTPEEVNTLGSTPLNPRHATSTAGTHEDEDSVDEPNSDSDTKSLLLTMIKRMDRHEKKLSNLEHKIDTPTSSSSTPSGNRRRARNKNIPLTVRVCYY